MQIEITGRNVDVTDAIKDYARRKIQKVVDGFSSVENVRVILDIQKIRHIAEVIVQGRQRLRLEASETSEDLYASIDLVSDKIGRQLRKSRDKVITSHQAAEKLGELEADRADKE